MTENSQQEAAEHAKTAAKEAGKAVRAVAEPVIDEAEDAAEKLKGTAEDAVDAARRVNPKIISKISGDTGVGFLALSVSIYAGTVAFYKFRSAFEGRGKVLYREA